MQYIIPDKAYDILKWVGLIVLPAVAAFVSTVGTAAGWDGTNLTVTVVTAVGTLLGAVLGVSAATGKPTETDDEEE